MDGNAEGFEESSSSVIQGVGYWKTGMRRYQHPLGKTTRVWIKTTKVETAAKIGMAVLAHLTTATRLSRINGDPCAGTLGLKFAILNYAGTHFFDNTSKFMAQRERCLNERIANARVLIGV
jgi:hypothetical protein